MKKIIKTISIALIIIIVLSISLRVVLNILAKNSVKATKEDLQQAQLLLEDMYPELVIEKNNSEVRAYKTNSYANLKTRWEYKQYGKDNYYVVYYFYGIMDTPEQKNDKVLIQMSKNDNSPFYIINDDTEWSLTIFQNKANGKKWDYSFIEHNL